ncbi:MAG: hydroxymethylglutaryl-CoA synthase [Bacteroidia bacterium]|nr:hydroxymethylglutaryl-CoA synthase [Bacteroidia bacterium]MBT8275733.1 hydroxymethylglutaryl-CoA synthase [Bacteroidia bacterium]NNK54669.1 hydroxymethylglutaryl-CoA synthase family protein [Flavobacteriaceae bacterium]
MKTGIDAISFYVPSLYVPMQELAAKRDIPYEKLRRGLGLEKMAIPDVNEDAASFAANALLKLIQDNDLDPNKIGRIYLGTESAVDGSKPTATYAIEAVENMLAEKWGERSFKNCDVVDLTFACVGAVDAMHNCLDWVQNGEERKAVVIASDLSKYELHSTGEYTQGAGAVAVLITKEPALIAFDKTWGVATKSVGDFFKPRRFFNKQQLAKDLLEQFNKDYSEEELNEVIAKTNSGFWNEKNDLVELFKEEPVFDGQYSNQCYSDRVTEALEHFYEQRSTNYLEEWDYLVFHLPYAYHGRRIIFSNWLNWIRETGNIDTLTNEIGQPTDDIKSWERLASKSEMYRSFVNEKIEMGERASSFIGNMYTASIFMALLSLLRSGYNEGVDLTAKKIGFIAYGSGSKSKVFEGVVQKKWKEKIAKVPVFENLKIRAAVDVELYEKMHSRIQQTPVQQTTGVALSEIEENDTNTKGLRKYS